MLSSSARASSACLREKGIEATREIGRQFCQQVSPNQSHVDQVPQMHSILIAIRQANAGGWPRRISTITSVSSSICGSAAALGLFTQLASEATAIFQVVAIRPNAD